MANEVFRTGYRVDDLIARRRARVRERLQTLTADDLRSTDVDDIVAGILSVGTIRVPVLRRHKKRPRPPITFQIPQPRPNSWDSRDGTGPPPISAYRFVLEVPFDGDGEVFDYPHTPAVRSIPATVELNSLYVKHEAVSVSPAEVSAQLEAHCDSVESILAAIREQAEPWNLECEKWVREEVDRQVEGLRRADSAAAAMSSPPPPVVEAAPGGCSDVAAVAAPLFPGVTEEVRRKLIAGLEQGAMKVRDDAESPLEELRIDIVRKGQARAGVADGRLSRFHLRVMEQCLQHLWSGFLRLREQCNAPPVESEEALARVMACYVDQVLSPVLQLVRGDRAGSGSWSGEQTVRDTAQRWRAKYAADASNAMAEVAAMQQVEAHVTRKPNTAPPSRPAVFHFGVVTALPIEFAAAKAMLDGVYPVPSPPDDPNHYEAGFIQGTHGKQHVIVTMTPKMGTSTAATTVSALVASFKPKYLLMIGIAGGIPAPERPEAHVRLGDVVISGEAGLFQHDNLKLEDGQFVERDNSARPSATLVQKARVLVANAYAGVRPWDTHVERATQTIKICERPSTDTDILYGPGDARIAHPADAGRLPDRSRIHVGKIGSGNMLLRDAQRREELRIRHGLVAIEMEGAGIGDASWQLNGRFLIIRGVSDYCDSHKTDLWQGYAAAAAAAVARALIELF